ncbi:MAG: protein kinase domain-containing protein [Aggregatilineales bacterium]
MAVCQTPNCPSEGVALRFDAGDSFGDMQIKERLGWSRAAGLYKAERRHSPILLKIAHDGCEDLLKREAKLLGNLSFAPAGTPAVPGLPTLQPAYVGDSNRIYGKLPVQQQDKYYIVYNYIPGRMLNAILAEVQPTVEMAAWLVITLAEAVTTISQKTGKLVLNIHPGAVLVREREVNKAKIYVPYLIDLGLAFVPGMVDWPVVERFGDAGYFAPEMLAETTVSPATDVYALGLMLHEMLLGKPVFGRGPRSQSARSPAIDRVVPSLAQISKSINSDLARVVARATDAAPARRPPDAETLGAQLVTLFGNVPKPPRSTHRVLLILGVIALIVFVLFVIWVVFLALQNPA